jgi:hypothetical protein
MAGIVAEYTAPDTTQIFNSIDCPRRDPDTDRDGMTLPSNSRLGRLRVEIMAIQQSINRYLTERMKGSSANDVNSVQQEDDYETGELDDE